MYRLFIDIPVGFDQEQAQKISQKVVDMLHDAVYDNGPDEVKEINYRLGNDEDRNKSNYLQINDNNHVSTKKCRINLNQDEDDE